MQVQSLEVREAKKMCISPGDDINSAFGYWSRLNKTDCCLSVAEAIEKRKKSCHNSIGVLKNKLAQYEADLVALNELEENNP